MWQAKLDGIGGQIIFGMLVKSNYDNFTWHVKNMLDENSYKGLRLLLIKVDPVVLTDNPPHLRCPSYFLCTNYSNGKSANYDDDHLYCVRPYNSL